ncbi:MAG: hypothetical protein GQE15_25415 [Archangiaceae bacterium]|nr:hypothetical protein [Archangiaceae bacterium]
MTSTDCAAGQVCSAGTCQTPLFVGGSTGGSGGGFFLNGGSGGGSATDGGSRDGGLPDAGFMCLGTWINDGGYCLEFDDRTAAVQSQLGVAFAAIQMVAGEEPWVAGGYRLDDGGFWWTPVSLGAETVSLEGRLIPSVSALGAGPFLCGTEPGPTGAARPVIISRDGSVGGTETDLGGGCRWAAGEYWATSRAVVSPTHHVWEPLAPSGVLIGLMNGVSNRGSVVMNGVSADGGRRVSFVLAEGLPTQALNDDQNGSNGIRGFMSPSGRVVGMDDGSRVLVWESPDRVARSLEVESSLMTGSRLIFVAADLSLCATFTDRQPRDHVMLWLEGSGQPVDLFKTSIGDATCLAAWPDGRFIIRSFEGAGRLLIVRLTKPR